MSELAELAAALVAVESINPALAADGSGEAAVAEVIALWGRQAGLLVEVEEVSPGRPNVLVTAPGRGGGRTLLLNGHLDTVGVAGMADPFGASRRDGRLYGRGAYDMKGALAAALVVAARAREERLAGDVIVACVIDEELGSAGTEALLRSRRPDFAVVCEPTDERICVAHQGFLGFQIETQGCAAHGSRPDLGVDAIAATGTVLVRLQELATELAAQRGHELLGPGSVHASIIEGGQEYSSYPERCLLTAERRTLPGETQAQLQRELCQLVAGTDATLTPTFGRNPFQIDPASELPQQLARSAGIQEFHGISFWTDAGLLAEAGVPSVLYGPIGAGAHATDEWVALDSLERCADICLRTAQALCAA